MTDRTSQKNLPPRGKGQKAGSRKLIKAVYLLLRISVIAILIAQVFNRNFENVMLCVLTLLLFTIPSLIEHKLKIDIPDALEIIILLFIYAAEILGEIRSYYTAFPAWDTMLHTLNGFLCAAIGFSLIDILNRNDRFKFSLSPFYLALFAFCFSMTVGVIWEFFEFTMDYFFQMDMQKDTIVQSFHTVLLDPSGGTSPVAVDQIRDVIVVKADGTQQSLGLGGYIDIGIVDTMCDLFVNFIGALVFSLLGFFYIRNRGKGSFIKRFIPTPIRPERSETPTSEAPTSEAPTSEALTSKRPQSKRSKSKRSKSEQNNGDGQTGAKEPAGSRSR